MRGEAGGTSRGTSRGQKREEAARSEDRMHVERGVRCGMMLR